MEWKDVPNLYTNILYFILCTGPSYICDHNKKNSLKKSWYVKTTFEVKQITIKYVWKIKTSVLFLKDFLYKASFLC